MSRELMRPLSCLLLLLFYRFLSFLNFLFLISINFFYVYSFSFSFFCLFFLQDPHGELKGQNVLIIRGSAEKTAAKFGLSMDVFRELLKTALSTMREARQGRPRPHLDDKMLAAWNGELVGESSQRRVLVTLIHQPSESLVLASSLLPQNRIRFDDIGLRQSWYCPDGRHLRQEGYQSSWIRAQASVRQKEWPSFAQLLSSNLRRRGRLAKVFLWKKPQTVIRSKRKLILCSAKPIDGFLDDYAFIIRGLLDLYTASQDEKWIQWADELQQKQDELFWDCTDGGYFTSASGDSTILLRLKEGKLLCWTQFYRQ